MHIAASNGQRRRPIRHSIQCARFGRVESLGCFGVFREQDECTAVPVGVHGFDVSPDGVAVHGRRAHACTVSRSRSSVADSTAATIAVSRSESTAELISFSSVHHLASMKRYPPACM